MKRIAPHRLALVGLLLTAAVSVAATSYAASTPAPSVNGALIKERVFNDCPRPR